MNLVATTTSIATNTLADLPPIATTFDVHRDSNCNDDHDVNNALREFGCHHDFDCNDDHDVNNALREFGCHHDFDCNEHEREK